MCEILLLCIHFSLRRFKQSCNNHAVDVQRHVHGLGKRALDRLTWGLYPLVVVGVDADLILFQVEGILTGLNGAQLVVAVKVRPPPQATVDDVGKSLPVGDLQAAVQ